MINVSKCLPEQMKISHGERTSNFYDFLDVIKETFGYRTERYDSLMRMYRDLAERLTDAPASSRIHFHNACPGGYLDHVLRVIELAHRLTDLYRDFEGVPDFTEQEMVFAAMHHDLGKLGDEDGPMYEPIDSEYDRKNGTYYKSNQSVQVMSAFDRTVYLLNKYGVRYSKNEMLGMKMADGLFDPANDVQFKGNAMFPHKTNIGYIIHWADWMATNIEKDQVRKKFEENISKENS